MTPRTKTGVVAVAVFDLDGTLCARDSLWPLLAAATRTKPRVVTPLLLAAARTPFVAARDRDAAKEALVGAVVGGRAVEDVDRLARRVAARLPLAPAVLACMEAHRRDGAEVWLASASVEPVVAAVAARVGATGYVATRLAVVDGRVTGAFDGGNCKGAEKLRRLDAVLRPGWRARAVAYGDDEADRPLLDAVVVARWVRRGRPVDGV